MSSPSLPNRRLSPLYAETEVAAEAADQRVASEPERDRVCATIAANEARAGIGQKKIAAVRRIVAAEIVTRMGAAAGHNDGVRALVAEIPRVAGGVEPGQVIVAETAEHGVVAAVDQDRIVTFVAEHEIVECASRRIDAIIAEAADQRIVSVIAVERIVATIAEHEVVALAAAEGIGAVGLSRCRPGSYARRW